MWERGGGEEAGKKKLTVSRGGDGRFICEWTQCGTGWPISERLCEPQLRKAVLP